MYVPLNCLDVNYMDSKVLIATVNSLAVLRTSNSDFDRIAKTVYL